MNKISLLCEGFSPAQLANPPQQVPVGTRCAMGGHLIEDGYLTRHLVTGATSQPHEIFEVPSDWCSVEAARLFKSMRGEAAMLGNIFAEPGKGVKPMVSRDSATANRRPCWHDLITGLAPVTECVAVFTEESKRRFWIDAPLSITGKDWRPYLHWRNVSRVLSVDLLTLQETLVVVSDVYSRGFSKPAILSSLCENHNLVIQFGFREVARLDHQLSSLRGSDELLLATFIVQKNSQE